MGKQRRKHSDEFKREAVRAAVAGDRSLSQVARDLGVERSLLQGWKTSYASASAKVSKSNESLEEENRRLRRENASLREDREILKKAAAFFAKEPR